MAIAYGGTISNRPHGDLGVVRDGAEVTIERHTRGGTGAPLVRLRYPALLQLIARLSEAAKDAAKERR